MLAEKLAVDVDWVPEVATETAGSVVSGRVWAGRASWLAGGQWASELRRQSFQAERKVF